MITYPKIQTIFRRNEDGSLLNVFSKEEFNSIKYWTITEKIDGTNIRVMFTKNEFGNWEVKIGGKTDNAQIPVGLLGHLDEKFIRKADEFGRYFEDHDPSVKNVIMFGEGYGPKIQNGGYYSKTQRFIAFDMWIDGWWLEPLHAKSICVELGIDFVPVLQTAVTGAIDFAINYVLSNPNSLLAEEPHKAEGVVASSYPLMLFRDGRPIKWKLKNRDFKSK